MTQLPSKLLARTFTTRFAGPLGELPNPCLDAAAHTAMTPPDDHVRAAVRDALRQNGYKPTGRGKPSSEYLLRGAGELPRINFAVDTCNVVSLCSGLPISVVDCDLLTPPWHLAAAISGSEYVFNASGQVIDISGLVCLHDALGPCANPVKDSQRTKTSATTTRTLSVIWGAHELEARVEQTLAWYRMLLEHTGATTQEEPVPA